MAPMSVLRIIVCAVTLFSTAHAAVLAIDYTIDGNIFDPNQTDVHSSLGTIDYSSGEIEFNTDTGEVFYNGSLLVSNNTSDTYYNSAEGSADRSFMVFNFDSINITSGVTILVSGSNGLALISQGDVNIEIDPNNPLNLDGEDGTRWEDPDVPIFGAVLPTNGRDLSLVSKGQLTVSGEISSNGGTGGNIFQLDTTGDPGGDAGDLTFAGIDVDLADAVLSARGGDGGDGTDAFGGDTGSGADGGIVIVQAETYTPPTTNPDVGGGSGDPSAGNPDGDPGSFPGLDPDNPDDPLDPVDPNPPPDYLIPEPSSSAMLMLAGLGFLTRRKRGAA
jgi:hypothetical protein